MKTEEEKIDLEHTQIDQWLGRLFNYTYVWVFFIIFGVILFSPIILTIIYHNYRLLFLFPISFILAIGFLGIVLKIEDKVYDKEEIK